MAEHNSFGKEAEEHAVQYLKNNGYTILQRNYFYRKAEVDIIATSGNYLVVVEVKARSTDVFGAPEQFVNKKKIQLLTQAIDAYVVANDIDLEVRFDIIAILRGKKGLSVNHIEDAFYYF